MRELRLSLPPGRDELLRAVAKKLHLVVPGFRPLACDLLADTSRIDVFGCDADGGAVLAVVGDPRDDLLLVARALAQREWLAPRLADWLKLAPELGVAARAPVQAVVLCPAFGSEASAAARAFPPGTIQLATWRYLRNGSEATLLLEPLVPVAPAPSEPVRALESPAPFRSGLTDRDLGLDDEERAEFD